MSDHHRLCTDKVDAESSTQHSQPKFTPGPWKVVTSTDGFVSVISSEGYEMTGHSPTWFKGVVAGDIHERDAHLISAAPEMYEALKGLLPYIDASGWRGDPKFERLWALQDTALAKAEGRS